MYLERNVSASAETLIKSNVGRTSPRILANQVMAQNEKSERIKLNCLRLCI
jgi:hypothetical protein